MSTPEPESIIGVDPAIGEGYSVVWVGLPEFKQLMKKLDQLNAELAQERKRREGLEEALYLIQDITRSNNPKIIRYDEQSRLVQDIAREALLTKVGEAAQAGNEGSEGGKV